MEICVRIYIKHNSCRAPIQCCNYYNTVCTLYIYTSHEYVHYSKIISGVVYVPISIISVIVCALCQSLDSVSYIRVCLCMPGPNLYRYRILTITLSLSHTHYSISHSLPHSLTLSTCPPPTPPPPLTLSLTR